MEEPAIREFFITCFLMFLTSLLASLSYQSLIQGNKPTLLSVHSIQHMLPKMPPSISLFIFLWPINSASSNSLYGTKICCPRITLAKSLCHLMIGSLTNRLESKDHLVLINQATKSVYILIFLFHRLIFVFKSITLSLVSTRGGTPSTGTVQIKLGFVPTSDTQNLLEFDEIFTELVKCSRPSLVSAPPVSSRICSSFSIAKSTAPCQTEGIGTGRSNKHHVYDDDGGLSSDDNNSDDEEEFTYAQDDNPPASKPSLDVHIPANPPQLVIHPVSISPETPTPGNLQTRTPTAAPTTAVEPTPKAAGGFSVPSTRFIPKIKLGGKKFTGLSTAPASPALGSPAPASPAVDAQGVPVSSAPARHKFIRNWSSASLSSIGNGNESTNASSTKLKKSDFKFEGANDIVGIVLLEIQNATDLPRLLNSSFDFLSLSFID